MNALNHLHITLTIRDGSLVVTLIEDTRQGPAYVSSAALPLVELEEAIEAAVTVAAEDAA